VSEVALIDIFLIGLVLGPAITNSARSFGRTFAAIGIAAAVHGVAFIVRRAGERLATAGRVLRRRAWLRAVRHARVGRMLKRRARRAGKSEVRHAGPRQPRAQGHAFVTLGGKQVQRIDRAAPKARAMRGL
jgi:hypothetical protein